ncbi:MAG TPA: helix-turn-helix domain-containing protein [Ohtaekwangia sp.]|uniref:helix-turn-helix domain-containing protein n=1 Tax=Ohtaekwangia sp. TaxID=2066019 RepID=UPI002F94A635
MKFQSYIPCDMLKPYIRELIIQEKDAEDIYKVLPGTGLVIGFQYKGKMSYLNNGEEVALSRSGITGILDKFRIFKNTADIGTVLVIFKEGGAAPFFREPLHELFRESLSLDHFMYRSELLALEERLCEARNDRARIQVVEQFLITKMVPAQTDNLVLTALTLIYKNKGNIRIQELAKQLHTSQGPLEKKFRKVIGTSPKKFASIVRFKNALQQYTQHTSLTALGYEAGFYDQAHFIKEFKNFTGDTPEKFFTPEA